MGEKNPSYIRDYDNPDEDVQLAAVERRSDIIQYIKNPTEKVQLLAVGLNWDNLRYIKDPSEAVQLAAVGKHGLAIMHIRNPSEAVQIAAVKQDGDAIKHIRNPGEVVKLIAVQNGAWITSIKSPSEVIKLAAVRRNGWAIRDIENPSEEMIEIAEARQLAFVRENPDKLYNSECDSRFESVQLECVQYNGMRLKEIKNQSEAVQLAAIEQNPDALIYAKNPSMRVRFAAGDEIMATVEKPRHYTHSYPSMDVSAREGLVRIHNKTEKFITIMSLAEYFNGSVETVTKEWVLAPYMFQDIYDFGVKGRAVSVSSERELNKIQDARVRYGFAVRYKDDNGKVQTLSNQGIMKTDVMISKRIKKCRDHQFSSEYPFGKDRYEFDLYNYCRKHN